MKVSNKSNVVYEESMFYCTFDLKEGRSNVTMNSTLEQAEKAKELFQRSGYESFIVKAKVISRTEPPEKQVLCYLNEYDIDALIEKLGKDFFKQWCAKVFYTQTENVYLVVDGEENGTPS